MFRKGSLPIVVLSAICSALFSWWVSSIFKNMSNISQYAVAAIISMMYFVIFAVIWASIYDLVHKVKIKANKYSLGCGISSVIAFTTAFKSFEHSNKLLGLIFVVSLVCVVILGNIASEYEEEE